MKVFYFYVFFFLFIILNFIFTELFHHTIHGQVCILTKRPDPAREGVLRWSLPKKELCFCQGVVAPAMAKSCSTMEEACTEEDLWFIDEPQELTLRHNWRKDILDELLERTEYCGMIFFSPFPMLLVTLMVAIVVFFYVRRDVVGCTRRISSF